MTKETTLSHLDARGNLKMVDMAGKAFTARRAIAFGTISMAEEALQMFKSGGGKGDAWGSSRIAGIMASKKTPELIPLTHPIRIDSIQISLSPLGKNRVAVFSDVRAFERTGVEMEAMVGVSIALLNVYDMVKALGKGAQIENVRLLMKTGGKSGNWFSDGVLSGKIEMLATSSRKGTPKNPIEKVVLKENFGLEGDAHAGEWHRQVSLLGTESIEKMRNKGLKVAFGSFAENIATSGIELFALPVGTLLYIGNGVILKISQIGKECHTGCAVFRQVGECVMPREGIFAEVLAGGEVEKGDLLLAISPTNHEPGGGGHFEAST